MSERLASRLSENVVEVASHVSLSACGLSTNLYACNGKQLTWRTLEAGAFPSHLCGHSRPFQASCSSRLNKSAFWKGNRPRGQSALVSLGICDAHIRFDEWSELPDKSMLHLLRIVRVTSVSSLIVNFESNFEVVNSD
jgi:hypothetical protein